MPKFFGYRRTDGTVAALPWTGCTRCIADPPELIDQLVGPFEAETLEEAHRFVTEDTNTP